MTLKMKYSDILADILKKKYSKCICPSEYLSDLSYKRPSSSRGSCLFGPNCEFTATCNFDQSKCTCHGKCTCGPQTQSLPPTARTEPPKTYTQKCTCKGICVCKSDESLLSKSIYRSPRDCNKAVCTCTVCLCQPDQSSTNLLPSYFRNTIKRDANTLRMSDEMMKKECQEIKELLVEHETTLKKKPLEKSKQEASSDTQKSAKRHNSVVKDTSRLSTRIPSKVLEHEKKRSSTQMSQIRKNSLMEESRKSILKSTTASRETKRQSTKKDKKNTRKEKISKKKHSILPPSTANTRFTATYCGCASTIRKPLRIRYYYSGGTEHYGVKVGHRNCLNRAPLVPKNMGWLWNIEDPTKGIRERKGWPPGFIGKNIKNMMQVMKRFVEAEATLTAAQSGLKSTWKSVEMVEETEPHRDEPPLLHIHKKGRTYNITFCPRESDEDIGPVPIPFSITEKKRDSGTESSESTLEFELHSPKVRGPPKLVRKKAPPQVASEDKGATDAKPPSSTKKQKKKPVKKLRTSKGSEENHILWEEQQTQMQNIS